MRILSVGLLGFLAALALGGCSSFKRDWKRAATDPLPSDAMTGRWEGTWKSDANGHSGGLQCLMTKSNDLVYVARFRASYAKVLHFSYTVPLSVQTHNDGWEFNGEADLGKAAGGAYYYEGRASSSKFLSTYRAKSDHGIFEMHRPAPVTP